MASDNALWITWYDLPEEGREAHLTWLHDTYIPAQLERRGFLSAAHYASVPKSAMSTMRRDKGALSNTTDTAVPTGERYILLFGGEHVNVFGDPAPAALHASLTERDRRMLSMRTGERVNIMTEAARVDGPDAPNYRAGATLAPCIQLGSFNCERDEADMLAWYAQRRMPAMTRLPGCVRTRKLASVCGWAKHAILYEFVSLDARNQHFVGHERGDPQAIAWGDRVVRTLTHAPGSANLACRLWPPIQ